MSTTETKLEREELAERITKLTLPGKSNDGIVKGLDKACDIVPVVIDDLNNWFEIVEVKVKGPNHIGIPMRYRWTVIRWAKNDMDSKLLGDGWERIAHLNADTREREINEMEARYRKQYGGVVVDCNFLVEFPESVFERMGDGTIRKVKQKKQKEENKKEKLREFIRRQRGED